MIARSAHDLRQARWTPSRARLAHVVAALSLHAAPLAAWAVPQQVVVELRRGPEVSGAAATGGGAREVAAERTRIEARGADGSAAGLEVTTIGRGGQEVRELLPWDMVRDVSASGVRHPARDYLAMATDLWRARIRIARGDTTLAAPLLAKHWEALRDAEGPTAQLAAEGLLRCAIVDADKGAAIEAWSVSLRLTVAGMETRFPELAPVLDPVTGLLPAIPPFAPASLRTELLARCDATLARATPTGEPPAATVAASALRRFAEIARLSDMPAAPDAPAPAAASKPPIAGPADAQRVPPAARVLEGLAAIVRAADAIALDRALSEFDRANQDPPAFLASWRLAAIGTARARIARAAPADVRNALLVAASLDLLAVPASRLDATGLVDGFALELAASLMREAGDAATAASLEYLRDERMRAAGVRPPEKAKPRASAAGIARTTTIARTIARTTTAQGRPSLAWQASDLTDTSTSQRQRP